MFYIPFRLRLVSFNHIHKDIKRRLFMIDVALNVICRFAEILARSC